MSLYSQSALYFPEVTPKIYVFSTTLDWVHGLQPEDLEKFLAEKKEQRMRVLCLDLEPTGIPQQVRAQTLAPPHAVSPLQWLRTIVVR